MRKNNSAKKSNIFKSFMFIGAGLLLLAVPVPQLGNYHDFIVFLGGVLVFGGIASFFFSAYLRHIFIKDEEIRTFMQSNQVAPFKLPIPKISLSGILLLIIIEGFLLNQFLIWRLNH